MTSVSEVVRNVSRAELVAQLEVVVDLAVIGDDGADRRQSSADRQS